MPAFLYRLAFFALTLALIACSSGGGDAGVSADAQAADRLTSTTATPSTTAAPTGSSLPPLGAGRTYGIDDLNDDGTPDEMCGPQDFGGGLVLLRYCDAAGNASTPPDGVTLAPNSLFSWPTRNELFDMTDISADAVIGQDAAGHRVFVIVFNTDGLFDTGRAEISSPDTFSNLVNRVRTSAP